MLHLRKRVSSCTHVARVSGTRMIAEGGDGGCRGDPTQGVIMARNPILDCVPLCLLALDQELAPEEWMRSWWNEEEQGLLTTLRLEGWF